jgi:hypothetical protein
MVQLRTFGQVLPLAAPSPPSPTHWQRRWRRAGGFLPVACDDPNTARGHLFLESMFIDQATPHGTRPNTPHGTRPNIIRCQAGYRPGGGPCALRSGPRDPGPDRRPPHRPCRSSCPPAGRPKWHLRLPLVPLAGGGPTMRALGPRARRQPAPRLPPRAFVQNQAANDQARRKEAASRFGSRGTECRQCHDTATTSHRTPLCIEALRVSS